MTEQQIKIRIPGVRFSIYGLLRGSLTRPLVIVVHGLAGNYREALLKDAVQWFAQEGFSTFRFNLYDYHRDARQLANSTLTMHGKDLAVVTRYLQLNGAKKIFAAGHSFGGPTIVLSDTARFRAIALWDPSYGTDFKKLEGGFPSKRYLKDAEARLLHWGVNPLIGWAMVRDVERLDWDALPAQISAPVLIVTAGAGKLKQGGRRYYRTAPGDKKLLVIPGANHHFDSKDGMADSLYRETSDWFKKFL